MMGVLLFWQSAGAGPQTFNQALSAVSRSTSAYARGMHKSFSAQNISQSAFIRGMFGNMPAVALSAPSAQSTAAFARTMTATIGAAGSLSRLTTFLVSIAGTAQANLTLQTVATHLRALASGTIAAASLTAQLVSNVIEQALAVAVILAASASKRLDLLRTLSVGVISLSALARIVNFSRNIAASTVAAGTLSRASQFLASLAASLTTVAGISRVLQAVRSLAALTMSAVSVVAGKISDAMAQAYQAWAVWITRITRGKRTQRGRSE